LQVAGTIADPRKPFQLAGTFPGGTSIHNYTPTSPTGGTSTYTLSGSGVAGHGQGTYTIARQGDNWVVTETTTGCVDGLPGSCRTNTSTITLIAPGH
jgi:hypothetical protein